MHHDQSIETADSLFKQGKFEEANTIYQILSSQEPQNTLSLLRMGEIALLKNELEKADELLQISLV